ncbi:ABC transporter permease subunit, partial [Candidatus Hakubella thermalkaliphila]|uniref:ABC transporter permease subunit n=1 Tax=Candidatus Hakubella thermalkaliphila TaxID=2754717 RepID=UPI001592E4C4
GCKDLRAYWNIFVPISIPAAAVVFLFQFTWVWNDLLFGLLLTASPESRPIMVGLAQLQGFRAGVGTNIPGLMGGAIVASVPTVVLFILLRRYFIQGLALQTAGE